MYKTIWYETLNKPYFTPSDEIFSFVWPILYLTIFISLILFIKEHCFRSKFKGYIFFSLQVLFNIIWSPIFFELKSILGGFLIINFLDIFIFLTIKEFYKVSKLSAYLLIPYFLWVIFATYLNFGFLIIN